MRRGVMGGLSRRRLRRGLGLFFLALAIPTAALIYHAMDQLKWEAFHRNQVLAEELAQRIDAEYRRLIAREEARPFTDYAFLNIAGASENGFLQRSPLSAFPPETTIPGLIGYFQVDAQGRLTTPLLPNEAVQSLAYGISAEELMARQGLQQEIAQILGRNRLVAARQDTLAKVAAPARDKFEEAGKDSAARSGAAQAEAPAQQAFDQLAAPVLRDEDVPKSKSAALDRRSMEEGKNLAYKQDRARSARKEQTVLPAPSTPPARQALNESANRLSTSAEDGGRLRIATFESEIDPLEISLLESGHFVLFRKVWRNGERQVQGLLISQPEFASEFPRTAFEATVLATMTNLTVAYRGKSLAVLSGHASSYSLSRGKDLRGELLYQTALGAPLGDFELIFSVTQLPMGPGGRVLLWIGAVLGVVLVSGVYLMYRLGLGQINLARQQQDFVSAVSHELKTPLTSIRMYGEILSAGWVDEEKRSRYYAYIFDESERLSRLINNVLQLARMTRSELPVNARELSLAEWMELARAKVGVSMERAGFAMAFPNLGEQAEARLKLDPDHFTQIMINLVDNAIKFSAKQNNKRIEIGCELLRDKSVMISVRDYGPGIPKDQMRKIFELFFRGETELTRETVGTGIGLALVHQLARLMGGRVDVANKKPGAEFRVYFPVARGKKDLRNS